MPGPPGMISQARSCPHCGNIYADDSHFCRKCGKPRASNFSGFSVQGQSHQVMPGQIALGRPVSAGLLGSSQHVVARQTSTPSPQQVASCQVSGASTMVARQLSAPSAVTQRPMPLVREVAEVSTSVPVAQVASSPLSEGTRRCSVVLREKPEIRDTWI